jgi:hypothetical protein
LKDKVELLPYTPSPNDFMAAFKEMDIMISSRFHSIILSRPVPIVAIPTTFAPHRLIATMESLGLSEYMCFLDRSTNLDTLKKCLISVGPAG